MTYFPVDPLYEWLALLAFFLGLVIFLVSIGVAALRRIRPWPSTEVDSKRYQGDE